MKPNELATTGGSKPSFDDIMRELPDQARATMHNFFQRPPRVLHEGIVKVIAGRCWQKTDMCRNMRNGFCHRTVEECR